jgi:hypothetical protein
MDSHETASDYNIKIEITYYFDVIIMIHVLKVMRKISNRKVVGLRRMSPGSAVGILKFRKIQTFINRFFR